MMLKPLDQITEAGLNDLITNAVPERKTLDYKQQLPDPNDAGKRELLADVSSFANTAGGDLIFGMTESAGVPTGTPGVQVANTDQEILDSTALSELGWLRASGTQQRHYSLHLGKPVLLCRPDWQRPWLPEPTSS